MAIFAILIPLMVLGVAVAVVPLVLGMRHQARTQALHAAKSAQQRRADLGHTEAERRRNLIAA